MSDFWLGFGIGGWTIMGFWILHDYLVSYKIWIWNEDKSK